MKPDHRTASENEINLAYEKAVAESITGVRRPGIHARARVEGQEGGKDVEAVYLRLLAQQILEENKEAVKMRRRDAVFDSSAAAVHGAAQWLKDWLGFSVVAVILLAFAGVIFGFQLIHLTNPESAGWVFGAKLGAAAFHGMVMFGISALLLICMFMFSFLRRNWLIATIVALLPVPFIYSDIQAGARASKEMASRPQDFETRTAPVARVPAPPSTMSQYDVTLSKLEAQYPQINPDSPRFDSRLTDRIFEAMQRGRASGMEEAQSLQWATDQIMGKAGNPAISVSQPKPAQASAAQWDARDSVRREAEEICEREYLRSVSSIPPGISYDRKKSITELYRQDRIVCMNAAKAG